jgi:hypothetical protein
MPGRNFERLGQLHQRRYPQILFFTLDLKAAKTFSVCPWEVVKRAWSVLHTLYQLPVHIVHPGIGLL